MANLKRHMIELVKEVKEGEIETVKYTECINTWGGELRDRVEIEDNRITGRFIDILPRRGEDIGKRWEIEKGILSITENKKQNSTNVHISR
ncbi:hypothetical protein ACFY5J_22705 [Peribacillus butanolivorans]|uniref:hypothetical protein n=1 Tax=Peribacillus butanolivorans TaxID=421767 RepID=UPI0036C9F9DF